MFKACIQFIFSFFGRDGSACLEKLSLCGTFEQKSLVNFTVHDNLKRAGVIGIKYSVLYGDGSYQNGSAIKMSPGEEFKYSITFVAVNLGTHILAIFDGSAQLQNSPFRFIVVARSCSSDSHQVPDINGNCICSDNTFTGIGGQCILFSATIAPGIGVLLLIVCHLVYVFNFVQRVTEDEKVIKRTARQLRAKLKIRQKDGFILSSERAPLWRRQVSFTVIQTTHMEAAARFSRLRDDFDIKHLDNFCLCLQNSGRDNELREWLLGQCFTLLDPNDTTTLTNAKRLQELSGEFNLQLFMRKTFGGRVADQDKVFGAEQRDWTQEIRFIYFKTRIWPLSVLWEGNQDIFYELQRIAGTFMQDLGGQCTARYLELMGEPKGKELCECHMTCDCEIVTERTSSSPHASQANGLRDMLRCHDCVVTAACC